MRLQVSGTLPLHRIALGEQAPQKPLLQPPAHSSTGNQAVPVSLQICE
jgi:hypothetical protein